MKALTIFIGSLLVFGIQPMVGNTLLPIFGGTSAVWMVCLAVFQTLLLLGYFYAHLIANPERTHGLLWQRVHIGALFLAAAWVFFISQNTYKMIRWTGEFPVPAIGAVVAVLMLVGVGYTLLSANASLVQALAARSDKNAYRLYAVSNLGSFCGLLAYPLVIEPFLAVDRQWLVFAVGLAVYAALVAVLVHATATSGGATADADASDAEAVAGKTGSVANAGTDADADASAGEAAADAPTGGEVSGPIEWFALSALSCFVLNAVSSHLCNDITPLPLLWAVLLALYLLSWVAGFTTKGMKASPAVSVLAFLLICAATWHIKLVSGVQFFVELGIGCAIILLGCWVIHARLYRVRPASRLLTKYYLFIALGGAVGGTCASLLLPAVFNTIIEYPVALVLLLAPIMLEVHGVFRRLGAGKLEWKYVAGAMAVMSVALFFFMHKDDGRILREMRNFYGTGRVVSQTMSVTGGEPYVAHIFEHAGIQHGLQPMEKCFMRRPTLCFAPHAGGLSITHHPNYTNGAPMRVAVAGMGVATLSTYARTNDVYRFYEINPHVKEIATDTNLFWYVKNCEAKACDIVIDDARRALEKERDRNEPKWDVLIIDVFAGDSIPPHMATKEAIQLYLDRLAPGGILSFHITNWHLNLSPLVKSIAKEFGLHLQGYGCWADKWSIGSYWTFFTREKADFFIEGRHGRVNYDKVKDVEIMTDQKHSLLPFISTDPMPEFE